MPQVPSAEVQQRRTLLKARTFEQVDSGYAPPCRNNPAAFADYEDPEEPATYEAQAACGSCRMRSLCRDMALEARPSHGVWAGDVWGPGASIDRGGIVVRRAAPKRLEAHPDAIPESALEPLD